MRLCFSVLHENVAHKCRHCLHLSKVGFAANSEIHSTLLISWWNRVKLVSIPTSCLRCHMNIDEPLLTILYTGN